MEKVIKLSSVTQAMRARDILRKKGIKSVVQRIPAKRGEGSCGYGLKIFNRFDDAVSILEENNIRVIGRASGGNR